MEKEAINFLAGKVWYIGTSGFSFKDWAGTIYPEGIKQSEMFTYYWQHYGFNALEINFTFYKMPTVRSLVNLLRKSPNRFKFAIKLHGSITHEGNAENLKDFLRVTRIYEEENKLLGYLAQFPYGFRKRQENISYLMKLIDIFYKSSLTRVSPLFLEFRHEGWINFIDEILKNENVYIVIPDLPKLKGMFPNIKIDQSIVYLRLHGRNENWFTADEKTRYDYFYSDFELREIISLTLPDNFEKAYVFFNNCYRGQALKNALKFRELVGGEKIDIFG
ncbi:MAG: DUF72 domain-containing protein [Fervidobacterium sp.]